MHRTEQIATYPQPITNSPHMGRDGGCSLTCHATEPTPAASRWQQLLQSLGNKASAPPAAVTSVADCFAALLTGSIDRLQPVLNISESLTFVDGELDNRQQDCVRKLMECPDVALLQGAPGTGKSRVLRELLHQLLGRRQRVLLTAIQPTELDAMLAQFIDQPETLAVRLPDAAADAKSLVKAAQRVSLGEHLKRLADTARQPLQHAIQELQTTADDEERDRQTIRGMRNLAVQWLEAETQQAAAESQRQQIQSKVQSEAAQSGAHETGWLKSIFEEDTRHKAALQELENRVKEAQLNLQTKRQEHEKWLAQTKDQEQVVALRQQRQWFSWQWWRAFFQGRGQERLQEFQCREQEAKQAYCAAVEQHKDAETQQELERQRHVAAVEQIIANEAANRQHDLNRRCTEIAREQDSCREAWMAKRTALRTPDRLGERPDPGQVDQLCAELDERVQHARRQLDAVRSTLQRLEKSPADFAADILEHAEVVAAGISVLKTDPALVAATGRNTFDCVIVNDADLLTEADLTSAAKLGKRLILAGRPVLPAETAAREDSSTPAGTTNVPFAKLWRTLHCDPRETPARWIEQGGTLTYQRVELSPAQRQRLEKEPVTDLPDVELHILNNPSGEPVLAEVVFPAHSFRIAEAKTYLYRQLDELALRPEDGQLRWVEDGECLCLEMHAGAHDAATEVAVELEQGVCEFAWPSERQVDNGARGSACWSTARLSFDRRHGWNRERAEQWLWEHAHLRDFGRTAALETQRRSPAKIAAFAAAVLGDDTAQVSTGASGEDNHSIAGEPIEFIRVAAPAGLAGPSPGVAGSAVETAGTNSSRHSRSAGPRLPNKPAPPPKPETGSEADLSDSRQRQRLPLDLQMKLPLRGVINLAEAEAVVRALEKLATEEAPGSVAVLSWQTQQVQLIEFLWSKSAHAAKRTVAFATFTQFRGREADVVCASLCRSPGAPGLLVKFAEHPDEWRTLLGSARRQLRLFGDPGPLSAQSQKGAASWERTLVAKLWSLLAERLPQNRASEIRQGVPA